MNIQLEEKGNKGRFYLNEQGTDVAEMTFVRSGEDKIIIDHTEVDSSLKGKGVGKELVAAAVLKARAEGFKIMPLCPFAKAVFDKTVEYRDVLF
jgi:predicted GNAT family acetyltransferase